MIRPLGCVVSGLLCTTLLAAQRQPLLPAGADTNDPAAYLELGRQMLVRPLRRDREVAESSLIRAARLDPIDAHPPYLLAVGMLHPIAQLQSLLRRGGRVEFSTLDARRVDSLMREAWLREPFIDLELEPLLASAPRPSPRLARTNEERALFAYFVGDPGLALRNWAKVLERAPDRIDIRVHRACTFYWARMYDSTVVELRAALASANRLEAGPLGILPPTELFHYAMGIAFERAGNLDSASEAYRRALVANLGIYMAHARLSNILIERADTAEALREASLAVDVAPHDAWIAGYYGALLVQVGRPADAVPQLRAAIALDSVYAVPYFLLGAAYSSLRRQRDALTNFETFLARAPRKEERRSWTLERVAALRTILADSTGP